MKKILFGCFLFFSLWKISYADTLNFRTNTLMFYTYEVEEKKDNFIIYTSNLTDQLMFTTSPYNPPNYQENYFIQKDGFQSLERSIQNKIKKYIRLTFSAEDFPTQMYYYINTQMLIWKSFHPELQITYNEEEVIETYQKKLEQQSKDPDWIKDYQIEEELWIETDGQYQFQSESCQIEERGDKIHIDNCSEKAKIKVIEKEEDNMKFYQNNVNLSMIIEASSSPCEWEFTIEKLTKEETSSEEEEKQEEKEEVIEETPPKRVEPTEKNTEEEKNVLEEPKKITNVPNTYENSTVYWDAILLCMLAFAKCFE